MTPAPELKPAAWRWRSARTYAWVLTDSSEQVDWARASGFEVKELWNTRQDTPPADASSEAWARLRARLQQAESVESVSAEVPLADLRALLSRPQAADEGFGASGAESAVQGTKALDPEGPRSDGWRTIDSAPRDGTPVLGWHEYWDFPMPCCWEKPDDDGSHPGEPNAWVYVDWLQHEADSDGIDITHWMPLPPPPADHRDPDGGLRAPPRSQTRADPPSDPAQGRALDVEAVARIIDPGMWEVHDHYAARASEWEAIEPGDRLAVQYRGQADDAAAPSLTKARAIIALSNPDSAPTSGEVGGGS